MWRDFFRRRQPILIPGAPGVGKTSFVRTLQYGQAYPLSPLDRTHFSSWHKIDAGGGHFLMQDTPGTIVFDADRIPPYLDDYLPELGTKGFGIINVVAYGYHEFLHTPENIALDASGRIQPDFLEERRQIEMRLAEQWTKRLKPTWLITIVNKADLWWHMKETVLDHYEKGAYYLALGDLGPMNIVVPFCALYKRFYDQVALSGAFDDVARRQQQDNLSHLLGQAAQHAVLHG